MSFFKRAKKFRKKVIDFEKSHTKNLWKGIKDDPKRLVLGVDPFSTKMWNKALGRDDRALVNQLGGATSHDYQVALDEGIDIGPGKSMHDAAAVVAAWQAGGELGPLAGAAAGPVTGATVAPATQAAITTGARMAVPVATAALEEELEIEEPTLGGLGSLRLGNVPVYRRAEGGRVPSKSPAQARLMRAVAHGWNKPGGGGPSRAVAREFANADRKYSGGFAENRYWTGGLAAMNEINSGVPYTLNFQEGGGVEDPRTEMFMGADIPTDRPFDLSGWSRSGISGMFTKLQEQGLAKQGWYEGADHMWYPAAPTAEASAGEGTGAQFLESLTPEIRGGDATEVTPFMPRIISGAGPAIAGPSGLAAEERAEQTALARQSSYRDQLREHKSRVAAALNPSNAARGGHMKYQEGGAVPEAPHEMRPGLGGEVVGHAEGPNPYAKHYATHPDMYNEWERRNHIDVPAVEGEIEPAIILPEEEEAGSAMDWLKDMLGVGDDSGIANRSQRELEQMEAEARGEVQATQARGGHVRGYQAGGLARVAPPLGGVPPWIEPEGYVEPEGFQLGGQASRMSQMMRNRRPPQSVSAYGQAPSRRAPRSGGLAAMAQQQRQALSQRGGAGRWSPQQQAEWRGRQQQNRGPATGMMANLLRQQEQRAAQQGGAPSAPQAQGFMGRVRQMADAQRQQATLAGRQGLTGPWQGDPANNPMRPRGPLAPGGGPIQLPGRRPPPWMPRINDPSGDEGGITGGARVPPNMRGFLQKRRMMNRPPPNVGGGVNRVGQQDQQGAQARAMQRGTGRRPMSRRGGFPGRRGMR